MFIPFRQNSMALYSYPTVVFALLVITISIPTAYTQAQTCASKLVPCAPYLNTTIKPPNTCCDPIKETVATDLPCLCNLYSNPDFLSGLGINISQALRLPRLCGVNSDTSVCKNVHAQAPGGSSTKPPLASTPSRNGASKITSSEDIGLLLISASKMLL
ncbi:non-specific lipid transfer protein GPI-anchored 9-like [Bidens hawaiensis]|uniref:non-specific lipid transfer protein GPI-anchored 9-like n=1 Tax=Bidens hawaiensis TaxID=980011 RepID=UPI00404AD695